MSIIRKSLHTLGMEEVPVSFFLEKVLEILDSGTFSSHAFHLKYG